MSVTPSPPPSRRAMFAMARDLLDRVLHEGAYSNLVLEHAQAPGLVRSLVKGALRWLGRVDYDLAGVLRRPLHNVDRPVDSVLRLGAYLLRFDSTLPRELVVNDLVEIVKESKKRHLAGFVNGVLRGLLREPDRGEPPLEVAVSHPRWLIERWIRQFGREEAVALCNSNNTDQPVFVRASTLRTTAEKIREELTQLGMMVEPGRYVVDATKILRFAPGISLSGLPQLLDGRISIQDESSMLVGLMLDPQPGELVLDMCAAPGGKTSHLAQLMQNRGRIIALDQHSGRLRSVSTLCERLGVTIIDTTTADSSSIDELPLADRVLVDAPCSGSGVLSRKPELRWFQSEEQIKLLQKTQLAILKNSSRFVKPGGILVYSTCSIDRDENEGVVEQFVEEVDGFEFDHPPSSWPDVKLLPATGKMLLVPSVHGTAGAFAARLRRTR